MIRHFAMVYIGFGILAASLSFLAYRYGFSNQIHLPNQRKWRLWLPGFGIINEDRSHAHERTVSNRASVVDDDESSIKQKSELEDDPKSFNIPSTQPDVSELKDENRSSLPSFTLNDHSNDHVVARYESQKGSNTTNAIAKSSLNLGTVSNQERQKPSSSMAPPSRPSRSSKQKPPVSSASLMPLPSGLSTNKPAPRSLPKLPTTLQPPPSVAAALRTPPSKPFAPAACSLQPSNSTLSPSKRRSKKVLLDPGHSPLDWAHLVKNPPTPTFLRGELVPANLIRVSPSLLKYQNGRKGKDAWGVWQGRVYNLTSYMGFHPGGVDELMKAAGREKDGERLFLEVHPWVSWESMLGECLIGILVGEDEAASGDGNEEGHLEEMD